MYYYLEWTKRRPSRILCTEERPDDITFESSFKVKDKKYILCGNISPEFTDYTPNYNIKYRKNQYLLSHLQKCVRRMDTYKATKTAKHLLDLDMNSFLRRLPIIMLEDVTLHESIPVIVWLMVSHSKGFTLKSVMVQWLLGVVYYLTIEPFKNKYLTIDTKEHTWKHESVPGNIESILYSLRIRKAYGGMKGDMNMIEDYIKQVLDSRVEAKTDKVPMITLEMEPLQTSEWIYQANDFHCNRSIPRQVKQRIPTMSEETIKKLIWDYSSSINHREVDPVKVMKETDWIQIKGIVKHVQKKCKFS